MALRIVCDVFFLVSLVFALAGTKGIIKMPDTFSRMQASTCVSTFPTVFSRAVSSAIAVSKSVLSVGSTFCSTAVRRSLIRTICAITERLS